MNDIMNAYRHVERVKRESCAWTVVQSRVMKFLSALLWIVTGCEKKNCHSG